MYQTVVKPDSNHPSKPAKECEEVKMVSNRNLVDSRDPVRSSYLNEIDSKDKSKSRQKQAKADARYPVGVYSACCSRKAKSNDDPNERKKIHQDDSRKTRKSKLKFHRHSDAETKLKVSIKPLQTIGKFMKFEMFEDCHF